MFRLLEASSVFFFKKEGLAMSRLIQRNVLLKTKIAVADEYESGERKLLNFGHTDCMTVRNTI